MIKPNELTLAEQSKTLSTKETDALNEVETFIDAQIRASFMRGKASVRDFQYESRALPKFYPLSEPRKEIIKDILFDKYRQNGWKVEFNQGEDDGPNRPGTDYWIFTVK